MFRPLSLNLPIQIYSPKGKGSGFLVNNEGYSFLVTARHVLMDDAFNIIDSSICILNQCADGSQARHELDLNKLNEDGNLRYHNLADLCVIRIFKLQDKNTITLDGVYETMSSNDTTYALTFDNMIYFKDIEIGNDIFILGYPSSIGIKDIPQIDYNQPLVRKGIISGLNRGKHKIIIDASVYPGNSGGIIINKINDKIAGVISQLIPYEDKWYNPRNNLTNSYFSNSGYSVIEPMDFVKELIQGFN